MENLRKMIQKRMQSVGMDGFANRSVIIGVLLLAVVVLAGGAYFGFLSRTAPSEEIVQKTEPVTDASHDDLGKEAVPVAAPLKKEKVAEKTKERTTSPEKTAVQYSFSIEEDESTQVPTGVTFVEATIGPLRYELSERFWGWRPNDIFSFVTDNVNNFQLGVIEVTRRTVETLTENISRTGAASAFDKNLENARSTCFVIEAESFMFPSSEGKYNDGLKELERYVQKLKKGEAKFFTRADNLIPLLREFEHLLGSCDENLVKLREEDGSQVSFFKADNYFYYAQGVANTLIPILKGIEVDFYKTIDRRNCLKELHYAIESLEHATRIHPIIILESDLDSFFANHRANMAAHISHARFYIDVLVNTLST